MSLTIIPAYEHPGEISMLFSEYTQALLVGEPSFAGYLSLQNYDEEVRHLEQKYGMPGGRLYLALWNGEPAGCIGLRRMDEENLSANRNWKNVEIGRAHV